LHPDLLPVACTLTFSLLLAPQIFFPAGCALTSFVLLAPLPLLEAQLQAREEKEKGNKAFADKDYEVAVGHFTKCIDLDPR
jgi:hypothetical protein